MHNDLSHNPPRQIITNSGLGPGIIVAPNTMPGDQKRGTLRAVIASVDNATTPKYATVLIDNQLPGESGYAIPVGWGPFAAGGTSGYTYFYNNTSGVGGSWVLVDADRRVVLALDQGVSTTAATPYYQAITDHKHVGTLNPDGYTNPQPVNLSAGESTGPLPYTQHAAPIQSVINPNGKILSTVFQGAMVDTDGSIINANDTQTYEVFYLNAGQVFTASGNILNGSPGSSPTSLILGNTSNGYGITWDAANHIYIAKWVSGTFTILSSMVTATQDNVYHSFRLSITPGSPNSIEASVDNYVFTIADSSLNLTSGGWNVTVYTG